MGPYHVDALTTNTHDRSQVAAAVAPVRLLTPSPSESISSLKDFCTYVPLRLSSHERALLSVLESTLHVSEYTDSIDIATSRYSNIPGSVVRDNHQKIRRILQGILEACHLATGLSVCAGLDIISNNNKEEQHPSMKLTASNNNSNTITQENASFFQEIFEIGRRNKILNPSKMRDTYGKMMYMLQDSQNHSVTEHLGFSLIEEVKMVRPFLEKYGVGHILHDERLLDATMFIPTRDASGKKITKDIIQNMFTRKKQCMIDLIQDYATDHHSKNAVEKIAGGNSLTKCISKEDLQRCIESIADAVSVVESNVMIVQRMLYFLEDNFDPKVPEKPYSLELRSGGGVFRSTDRFSYGFGAFGSSYGSSSSSSGPTLSHSHSTQYTFVWQSLTLWGEVQRNMHRLWICADHDLLSTTRSYELLNTGQGLNRVQACPRVGKVMQSLLSATQKAANAPWVGLSVIHLGDRDVPNALIFIDKYTQIPHILKPIADFIDGMEDLCNENNAIAGYINRELGSLDALKMIVLSDYFKHGFDGSGDDGGSCIDGRLTSR